MSTYSNRLQILLSKTYYNMLFGSFTRDRHAWRIYLQTFTADENHS